MLLFAMGCLFGMALGLAWAAVAYHGDPGWTMTEEAREARLEREIAREVEALDWPQCQPWGCDGADLERVSAERPAAECWGLN